MFFKFQVAHVVPAGVVVEHTVEAEALGCNHRSAHRHVGLQPAGSADSHNIECSMLFFHCPCFKIHISQSIKFGDHDVDIITADAMRKCHHRLSIVGAANGVEFSTLHIVFLGVEIGCYHIHASRVATHYNIIFQLIRTQVDVKHRAVRIDNQFGIRDYFFCHCCRF